MATGIRITAAFALAMTAAACGRGHDADPVSAARGLLTAIQAGDAKAFEAHLDRAAVRADLRRQMTAVAEANRLDLGGPSDAALDRMIGLPAFHLVQADGRPLAGPPSPAQVAGLMTHVDGGRACLHDLTPAQACLVTFAHEAKGWLVVGMPASGVTIAVPPEPKAKG